MRCSCFIALLWANSLKKWHICAFGQQSISNTILLCAVPYRELVIMSLHILLFFVGHSKFWICPISPTPYSIIHLHKFAFAYFILRPSCLQYFVCAPIFPSPLSSLFTLDISAVFFPEIKNTSLFGLQLCLCKWYLFCWYVDDILSTPETL